MVDQYIAGWMIDISQQAMRFIMRPEPDFSTIVPRFAFSGKFKRADHLSGDVYFRTRRENHNLDRCRTQFKLVAEMETKFENMTQIIEDNIHF